MTKPTAKIKATRKQHSPEFREEASALAEKIGASRAAKDPGLHQSQFYGWRAKARAARNQSDLEQSQAAEIARLKRRLRRCRQALGGALPRGRPAPRIARQTIVAGFIPR